MKYLPSDACSTKTIRYKKKKKKKENFQGLKGLIHSQLIPPKKKGGGSQFAVQIMSCRSGPGGDSESPVDNLMMRNSFFFSQLMMRDSIYVLQ